MQKIIISTALATLGISCACAQNMILTDVGYLSGNSYGSVTFGPPASRAAPAVTGVSSNSAHASSDGMEAPGYPRGAEQGVTNAMSADSTAAARGVSSNSTYAASGTEAYRRAVSRASSYSAGYKMTSDDSIILSGNLSPNGAAANTWTAPGSTTQSGTGPMSSYGTTEAGDSGTAGGTDAYVWDAATGIWVLKADPASGELAVPDEEWSPQQSSQGTERGLWGEALTPLDARKPAWP